jgi:hypothetical protein
MGGNDAQKAWITSRVEIHCVKDVVRRSVMHHDVMRNYIMHNDAFQGIQRGRQIFDQWTILNQASPSD